MSLKSRHVYNPKWALTYRWLKASKQGKKHYYCCCCQKDLSLGAGLSNVEIHATRDKHMKNERNWMEELKSGDSTGQAHETVGNSNISWVGNNNGVSPEISATMSSSSTAIECAQIVNQPLKLREAEHKVKGCRISNSTSKREHEQDDEYDLFGKMLAKKLRKLPELDREVLMHDINGMVMNFMQRQCNYNFHPNNHSKSVLCTSRMITMDHPLQHLDNSSTSK